MSQSGFTKLKPGDKNLVWRIVKRVYTSHTPAGRDGRALTKEDLFHFGIIGLLEAQRNFSPEHAAKWETFAAYRIEGAIIDNLRKAPLIRLPQDAHKQVKLLQKAESELEDNLNPVSSAALALKLGWSLDQVEKVRTFKPTILTAVNDDSHSDEFNPANETILVEQSSEADPQTNLIRQEIADLLEHCLSRLPEVRDRIIVKARQLEDITLKELAASFNCSIESIRLRERSALTQLKECLQHNDIDEVY